MKNRTVILSAVGVCAAALVYAQTSKALYINGKIATTDLRVIDGRTYAPLSDLSKALSLDLVKRPDGGLELTRAGGASAIEAKLTGKTGDWLFDGGWRFKVTGMLRVESHTKLNPFYSDTIVEPEEGGELIKVDYVIRNGNKKPYQFAFGDTFLASGDGTSEPAYNNDFRFDGSIWNAKTMLPGAETKGSLFFRVPKGFVAKDLIVGFNPTWTKYDEAVEPNEPTVLRIGL